MGCICGPSIANLFVYLLEKSWLSIHKLILYYRVIDDILLEVHKLIDLLLFKSQFLNLKSNIVIDDKVNFLDLIIWYDKITGRFLFSLFTKPYW